MKKNKYTLHVEAAGSKVEMHGLTDRQIGQAVKENIVTTMTLLQALGDREIGEEDVVRCESEEALKYAEKRNMSVKDMTMEERRRFITVNGEAITDEKERSNGRDAK